MNCPQCGMSYIEGQRFCTGCGKQLHILCTNCGNVEIPGYSYCTKCGKKLVKDQDDLAVSTDSVLERSKKRKEKKPTINIKELIADLHMIGVYRDGIPASHQGWCSVLGLYVWYRGLDKYTHGVEGVWLKAGSKYRTQFEGWTDYKNEWDIKKYKPGEWEKLVKPTLQIAKWL